MVAKKLLLGVIGMSFLGAFVLTGCLSAKTKNQSNSDKVIKIGISQLVEHPALDKTRIGFIDALSSKGFKDGEKIKIDFQNAQGDIPTAQTIASNFISEKKDLIFAIATPSAQAAYSGTKNIPILITAVTDPVKSGLVKSLNKPGTNVTGTSDILPMDKQFQLMKKLIPNCKKVGILYNTSEANSEIQVNMAKEKGLKMNLEIIAVGISSSNEISQALNSLIPKIDALYTVTDNLVASSMPLISSKAIEKGIPIIGAEKAHVEAGALATEGIDYYKLGFQTGLMAVDIINGKKPKDMPVQTLKETTLTINEVVASKLKITIPSDLKSKAVLVKGGAK
ncbi:ABC transporter substrate-binding protein [Clostridium tagluense]|uniref:ABC transporter substrate-binding protein n=1 Tax=Clostridium TaxID=1485 RepID=UPI0013E980D0|nr:MULTISPECIES: ABC transporter substrate-binding protein [Clostridium]MBU3128339.1 ABC transporter substrate-binding protein [Clostridium tagluense]MBW9157603.1 ABC transporter substrate-binding protein [Clostridium tagluense]MBZ9622684.1 ABC transporter substrate-binding protein [Clostridium sp. FP2]MCB2313802.1 ABC transporter substrate-binding protein [Clostridium tagluense]MCB2318648.1 ABC transporter substrate-binding protein [Clostridium tagluense]